MDADPGKRAPEMGPYYAPDDYAGIFRRVVILVVDGLALGLSGLVALALSELLHTRAFVLGWLVFAYVYLAFLEATPIGTLGFLVTGVKVVTLKGERPSLLRMTFRLLLWILGPINFLIDLYWMTGDDFRQTLRDKCAGTLVIRKAAVPAGQGEITLKRYTLLSYCFVFYEIRRPA
ncbi:MAG TPA: RDD family protein [Planctomycetota bacterium]|nr:RDD family protein [Planctomycetota bacterium]